MILNMLKKEVKVNFLSSLIWIIVFVGFILMYIPVANLMQDEMDDMIKIIEKMPELFIKMFNFEPELIASPEGLFGSEGMSFIYILSAVFSATLAGSIFSKEFELKTIDYLLVKPIKRFQVFLSKTLTMLFFIISLVFVFTVSEIISFSVFIGRGYSTTILYSFGLYTLSVLVFFGGLSTIISFITRKSRLNTTVSIGIIFFMYFGDSLGRSFDNLEILSKISIFNYIPLADTIVNEKMYWENSLLIIISGLLLYIIAYIIFRKIDIKT